MTLKIIISFLENAVLLVGCILLGMIIGKIYGAVVG